jgi:hypothetical protein
MSLHSIRATLADSVAPKADANSRLWCRSRSGQRVVMRRRKKKNRYSITSSARSNSDSGMAQDRAYLEEAQRALLSQYSDS